MTAILVYCDINQLSLFSHASKQIEKEQVQKSAALFLYDNTFSPTAP